MQQLKKFGRKSESRHNRCTKLGQGCGWILRAPVSTGTTGRETPAGVFAIIEKQKDHHSTLYDDAWMPNMQRIT
ncbi:MAG TPA: L,D-transpeptidase family protein, partial [Vicinamibacterales bacterium]|nr:L,D-transpeptidase family protein [Vicinamibacterales bacterium]